MYDVTNRESFTDLQEVWMKEVDQYSTNSDCVIMLVGNKVDLKVGVAGGGGSHWGQGKESTVS